VGTFCLVVLLTCSASSHIYAQTRGSVQTELRELLKDLKYNPNFVYKGAADFDAGDDWGGFDLAMDLYGPISKLQAINPSKYDKWRQYAMNILGISCKGGVGPACNLVANSVDPTAKSRKFNFGNDAKNAVAWYENGCNAEFPSGFACAAAAFAYGNSPNHSSNVSSSSQLGELAGLGYRSDLMVKYSDIGCTRAVDNSYFNCFTLSSVYRSGGFYQISANPSLADFYTRIADTAQERNTQFAQERNDNRHAWYDQRRAEREQQKRDSEARFNAFLRSLNALANQNGSQPAGRPGPQVSAATEAGGISCNHGCENDSAYLGFMKEAQNGSVAASYRAAARYAQCVLQKCASVLTPAQRAQLEQTYRDNTQKADSLKSNAPAVRKP
jgi:hypothetical protein